MKNSLSKTALMIICIAFVVIAGNAISVKQLEIVRSDLSGWIPQDDMRIYEGTELYDYMDGAAPQYLEKGVQMTGAQWLDGQNNTHVHSMIMDFGKDSNAIVMFLEQKTQNADRTVVDPVYPDSVAFMTLAMGGVHGYGRYSNFYFEIAATGFSDTEQAIATFDTMLTWYIQKIQSLRSVAINKMLTAGYTKGSLKNVVIRIPDFPGKQPRQGNLLNGRLLRDNRKSATLPVIERIQSRKKPGLAATAH
jgi:hypothetical protein